MKVMFLTSRQLLSEIPEIPWVDEDNGEFDHYDVKPNVPQGTVLITTSITSTRDVSETRQLCRGQVILRWWVPVTKQETSSKAPDEALNRSLAFYDTADAIYKKFQGYSDDEIDDFSRQSAAFETRRDDLKIFRWVFTTSFIDETAEEA